MRNAALDAEAVEDLEVVFSEVAANAVAASPTPPDEVRVLAQLEEALLVLEVSNRADGVGVLSLVAPDPDDPLRPNGRGLLIASAFVSSVQIDTERTDERRVVKDCVRSIRSRGSRYTKKKK